ncbi:MAG: family 10 glycosylhydrolase [Lentisphaeria bacterium]|nr:family 10 glycosylhydrolase [Lentisphaeria bacterium]
MKKMVWLLMAVAFCCTGCAGTLRETRAMWLWGSVVRDKGADFVAKDFRAHNLNCAVMLVKGMGGSASWDSKIALKKNLSKGDVLEQFGKACKKNKIDLHAWFVVNSDEAWLEKHPEDHYYHCGKDSKDNGAVYVSDCERVCTLSTGYRNYLLAMIRELAENAGKYNLKGIHLDYIRYPHAVYCFCPKHIAKGKALGVDIERLREILKDTFYRGKTNAYMKAWIAKDPDVIKWVTMREDEITELTADIRKIIDEVNPKLELSAAFMPDGAEKEPSFGICHYGQNWTRLGHYLDFICPMTYHSTFKKPVTWPGDIALRGEKITGTTVLVGLGDSNDYEDAAKVISYGRKLGMRGFCYFRYNLLDKPGKWAAFDAVDEKPALPLNDCVAPCRKGKACPKQK